MLVRELRYSGPQKNAEISARRSFALAEIWSIKAAYKLNVPLLVALYPIMLVPDRWCKASAFDHPFAFLARS